MIDRRFCLMAALAAFLPAPTLAIKAASNLNDELDSQRSKQGLPALAAAVVKEGVIIASGVAGVRVHGTELKATINDRFHLGSDTKAMTALLAGMAVDEGKLQWTSTIGDVLGKDVPGLDPGLAAISLEQLLSHTSGLPSDTEDLAKLYSSSDAFDYNLPKQRLRILAAWKSHRLMTKPGSAFHYANLGYLIAGAMIEKAAGHSWEELMIARLFVPLGLANAGLGPQATMGHFDAPVGHQISDKGSVTPMPWGPAADVPPVLGPAGVAHMSVLDFARWAGWNAGQGKREPFLVKPETLERIYQPHIKVGKLPNHHPGMPREGEYALGWGIVKFDWAKAPVLTHSGSNGMNIAKILVDPDQDLGVVAVTNFPGQRADDAVTSTLETLYRRHAG